MSPTIQGAGWRRWVLLHVPSPLLREPFLLWLSGVCILTGVSQLLGAATPPLAAQLMPAIALKAWNLELVVGGLCTIIGITSGRTRVLRLGLQPLAVASFAYAVGLFYVAGSRAILSAGVTIAFAVAALIKLFVYTTSELDLRPPLPGVDGR